MYQSNRLFERELRFTAAYRENAGENKAIREYRCLKEQIPSMFVSPRREDLLAGRINRPLIGFFPNFEGDGIDKVAYSIDEQGCREALAQMERDPSYSAEETGAVREMLGFWHTENTNAKIRRRFPGSWGGSMGGDDYNHEIAAIHPLYRIAGAHPDMKKLFALGLGGLRSLAREKMEQARTDGARAMFAGMDGVVGLIQEVVELYIQEAARLAEVETDPLRREELAKMRESLTAIRERPPRTLREALQLQVVFMLSGRFLELGRLDDYLCEYYCRDIESGELTHEEAIRLVDNLFTIIEQERGRDTRAIIGGVGREHEREADQFALLVLDVLERRKFRFYPQVSLRVYSGMDERLYTRSLELLGEGYTFPMLYNDDINIPSVMHAMEVPREAAEQYAFFGCGEYMLACRSIGTPNTALNLAKVLELTLHNGSDPLTGKACGLQTGGITERTTFDELLGRYEKQVEFFTNLAGEFEELVYDVCAEECSFLLISLLYDCCVEREKAILEGGIFHLGGTVETYGNVTAADSLNAIREVVFEQKRFTLPELVTMLDADFDGFEQERLLLERAGKFGNDNEAVDALTARLHEFTCNAIRNQKDRTRLDSFLAVLINNSMNVSLGAFVGATPDGRHAREFLSNGNGAYSGRDQEGITALIRSLTRMDTSIHAGGNQNLKFSRGMFQHNQAEIRSILQTFFELGGQQTNISVVDQKELEDAMIHPELHENLVVRVGGFSARFVELDPKVQRDVLLRTAY